LSEDPKWDSKTFFDFLWRVLIAQLTERAEREALVQSLLASGALHDELYQTIRQEKLQGVRDAVEKISQGDADVWLAVLQAYQGPKQ
jgi:hypothetical protein